MITTKTVLCGLIGDPVAHSLSPAMHNAAFAALALDYAYLAFHVECRNVDLALAGLKVIGVRGVNVTVPYKSAVMPFLDELDVDAKQIGAVNTIVFTNGQLKGFNTDALGFSRALDGIGFDAHGKMAVVLGAGGAAHAIAFTLAKKVSGLIILTRPGSLEKGKALAARVGNNTSATTFLELEACLEGADLLVNATGAGMNPRVEETLIPEHLLKPGMTVFDVVYNPNETRLVREARRAGCKAAGGLEMLVYQGARSFELWTGREAPIDIMRQAALNELGVAPSSKKSIALIGFMGSGKSSVGKLLAQRLKRKFIDVDKLIERKTRKSIARIFAEEGEAAFRTREAESLRESITAPGSIIACGGGVITNPVNVAALKGNALVIYLKSSPRALLARLSHSRNRPLLKTGDKVGSITGLLGARTELYEQAADIIIDTSNLKVEAVADAIITELAHYSLIGKETGQISTSNYLG